MLKSEWLEREKQAIGEDKRYKAVMQVVESCLQDTSNLLELDDIKSIKDCFNEMEKYAEEHQENGFYYFDEDERKDFVFKYLNIEKQEVSSGFINLSDFL